VSEYSGGRVVGALVAVLLLLTWVTPAAAHETEIATSSIPDASLGVPYSFQLQANDGQLPYVWTLIGGSLPPGISVSSGGTLSGTPTRPGEYSFRIWLEDGHGSFERKWFDFDVNGEAVHITTTSLSSGQVGSSYTDSINASGGIPGYTITKTSGSLPNGTSLAGNGSLSGTPTEAGTFPFTAKVTDSVGETDTQSLSLTIAPPPLVLTTSSLPDGKEGDPYSTSLSADGGTPPFSWSVSGGSLPSGLSLSSGGTISGTPTEDGPFSVTIKVDDSGSQSKTKTFNLDIDPPDLILTTSSLPDGKVGVPYSKSMSAEGGTPPYSWSVSGGTLPGGLSFSTAGTLSGTPSEFGAFNVTIKVDDAGVQSQSKSFSFDIAPPDLEFSTGSLPDGKVGDAYSAGLSGDGGTPPFTWSITDGSLPAGLNLSSAGSIDGTPSEYGDFDVTVKVADSGSQNQTNTLSIHVEPSDLVFVTSSVADGQVGIDYAASFSASGGAPPYSWSVSGGSLPPGLNLSGDGDLTGNPTQEGDYSFTVKVADDSSQEATRNFQIAIAPYDLAAESGSLAGAQVEIDYEDGVSAIGGQAPYSWSVSGGSLPPGLNLESNGEITGTPQEPGSFDFTAQVTDGTNRTAEQGYVINVADNKPLELPEGEELPLAMIGQPYVAQLSAEGGTPPYAWDFTRDPNIGLDLSESGLVTGTPIAAGSLALPVKVTDSAGATAERNIPLSVTAGAGTELLISDPVLVFRAAQGGSRPGPKTVAVSTPEFPVRFTVTKTNVDWLFVDTVTAKTPSIVKVGVDPGELAAGDYEATITFQSELTGETKTTTVHLLVRDVEPSMLVQPSMLRYIVTPNSEPTVERVIRVRNPGRGRINYAVRVLRGRNWISVADNRGMVGPNITQRIRLVLDRRGVRPGFRRGAVEVRWEGGSVVIPVVLFWAEQNLMDISHDGMLFEAVVGNDPFRRPPGITMLSQAASLTSWTVEQFGGKEWLTMGQTGGLTSIAQPGLLGFQINSRELPVGVYYANLRVTVEGALNSPQNVPIILNVITPDLPSVVLPDPAGLLFIARPGEPIAPQQVTLLARTSDEIPYRAAIFFSDGADWLALGTETGITSLARPAVISLSATARELPAGVYRARVSISSDNAFVRAVNVTLIVTGEDTVSESGNSIGAPRLAESGCTAKSLVATDVGLPFSFTSPASWPVPLRVLLKDSCGNAMADGQITATFSNGDPAVALKLLDAADGTYAATWVPASVADNIAVRYDAAAPGLESSTVETVGSIAPNEAPTLAREGILHNLSPLLGGPLAPGNIVAIFGENMAAGSTASTSLPLPTSVGGTSVIIGGLEAPLYFVSSKQINAMIPFELDPGRPYQVIVSANNALTMPEAIMVEPVQPGVAAFADGKIIAQHSSDGSLVTADNPAKPGEFLVIYLAGMGRTDEEVHSGDASPADPLARPEIAPVLTIAGQEAQIFFAGLTPGLVGLYQINFQVPENAPSGEQELMVDQSGATSNMTTITIQ
jgi:uncharacterized protein (TIGR03437 family)